ncbi:13195_t:CDS:2, partial [Gigaspora margarita]
MVNKDDELPKKMEQYDSDDMENIIPPKRLEIWDMRHVLVTHDEVYFYANDDNLFFWIKDEESIIKKRPRVSNYADSYWKSEDMVKQLCEKAIPIFNALYSGCIGIFCFDQSTNYNAYALDALMCSRMTLYPKVEKKFKFKNRWFIHNYEKTIQPMFFLNEKDSTVKFKGIKK